MDAPVVSPTTISATTIAALDADPLFAVPGDPKLVESLGSASMGMLISFLLPYLKTALLKYLQEGIANPPPILVLARAREIAEKQYAETKT